MAKSTRADFVAFGRIDRVSALEQLNWPFRVDRRRSEAAMATGRNAMLGGHWPRHRWVIHWAWPDF